jgi:dTDP-4-dehydrorhamnose reductase
LPTLERMRLLILGASGTLGTELSLQAREAGHIVIGTSFTTVRDGLVRLDIRDTEAVAQLDADFQPDAIVNAAYDQADWETTALAPVRIAAELADCVAKFVHVSSDAVFTGGGLDAYDESSAPAPATAYGAAKAAAEVGVATADPQASIVRTSWILGGRAPFETFVHDIAAGRREGVLFADDFRCPVHVDDLASAVLELCGGDEAGLLHVAGADLVSRFDLAQMIAERDGLNVGRFQEAAKASVTGEAGASVRLDISAARELLATPLRGARAFLKAR